MKTFPHRSTKLDKLVEVQNLVGKRPVKVSCSIKHPSAAVAIATCSGVKLGLAEVKVTWLQAQRKCKCFEYLFLIIENL
jgi:hypothetical protein